MTPRICLLAFQNEVAAPVAICLQFMVMAFPQVSCHKQVMAQHLQFFVEIIVVGAVLEEAKHQQVCDAITLTNAELGIPGTGS